MICDQRPDVKSIGWRSLREYIWSEKRGNFAKVFYRSRSEMSSKSLLEEKGKVSTKLKLHWRQRRTRCEEYKRLWSKYSRDRHSEIKRDLKFKTFSIRCSWRSKRSWRTAQSIFNSRSQLIYRCGLWTRDRSLRKRSVNGDVGSSVFLTVETREISPYESSESRDLDNLEIFIRSVKYDISRAGRKNVALIFVVVLSSPSCFRLLCRCGQ